MVKDIFNTLDLVKFLASIGIVALHVNPFVSSSPHFVSQTMGFVTSLCVPIFFTISAFLYFRKYEEALSVQKYSHFFKRIFILYLCWLIIHIVLYRGFEERGDNLFVTILMAFGGSWFYVALVISMGLVTAFMKTNKYIVMLFGIIVYAYFVGCHCGFKYTGLFDLSNTYCGEWFLSVPYALTFIILGMMITQIHAKLMGGTAADSCI